MVELKSQPAVFEKTNAHTPKSNKANIIPPIPEIRPEISFAIKGALKFSEKGLFVKFQMN